MLKLLSNTQDKSLQVYFDFPEAVRVPCEQYLLYFVQFLKDVGVEASADIQHQAGRVLFSVTPSDDEQALENIRQALMLYLSLPAQNSSGVVISADNDLHILQLRAQIDHLSSQLRYAAATMRAQEATIRAQEHAIDRQDRLLSGKVLTQSVVQVSTKGEEIDKEELLDGTIALASLDVYGVRISWAAIFRKAKQLFSDNKEGL
jgi:hypothetical protein